MTHALRGALVAVLVLTWAAQAAAQNLVGPSRTLVPAVFPRWDLSGSLGMQNIAAGRNPEPWRSAWDHKLEYRADVGWYWTTHLKTELTASTSTLSHDYEVETFPSGASSPVYAYTNVERRVTLLGPGVTWQFGENAFVHPYVTGGVQLWIVQQHRFRSPDTYRFGPSASQVPPIDDRTTTVLGRPFVAGGFKSYISRKAFVRSEARAAFSSAGTRQLSITAGIGVDF